MIYINFYTKAMYHFWYTDTKNGIAHIPKVVFIYQKWYIPILVEYQLWDIPKLVFCPITVNNLTQ